MLATENALTRGGRVLHLRLPSARRTICGERIDRLPSATEGRPRCRRCAGFLR